MGEELLCRMPWLIKLRWIGICGVFCTVTAIRFIFLVSIPLLPLYAGAIALILSNLFYIFYARLVKQEKDLTIQRKKTLFFTNFQISIDLSILVFLIHFSGGLENPFIFYFIFHMIIASILLSSRAAYFQSTFVVGFLGTVVMLEYCNFLPHYHLDGFIPYEPYENIIYLVGTFLIFTSTLFLSVYMATSIVNQLRTRERELSIANEQLNEQDRRKSQYVWTVAHDIQSHLSTIQSCLKVTLNGLTGEISDKSREMVGRADERTLYLLHYTRDLLNLSRIKSTRELPKEELQLIEVVEKVIEGIKMRVTEKGLSLIMEGATDLPSVYANRDEMEQLFLNLVVNAIKYTPCGGKVTVDCRPADEDGFIQASISDTGIGIPKDDLPHIFEEFYRAKNVQSVAGEGTGLGLSIVQQIIKDHNGKMWVESKEGEGTKLTFLLPVSLNH